MYKKTYIILLIIFSAACARIGSPTGGDKDTQAPKLVKTYPKNQSVNFKGNEIILHFDEYIQLKNINKNLLISPPLKQRPNISPLGTASKEVRIKFLDTLLPNTTYLINFGQSIVDYNEGNKFGNFQFVFSTGKKIDSFKLKGKITPIHFAKNPTKIIVGLYQINKFYDSIVYRKPPYYVAVADQNGLFNFNFLAKGKYKIRAIADENNNYVYNSDNEAIGFISEIITIPKDSLINIQLFKELKRFNYENTKQLSKNHIQLSVTGKKDSLKIKTITKISDSVLIYGKKNIDLWYKSFLDTVKIEINNGKYHKTFKSKRKNNIDSLVIRINKKGNIHPLDTLIIIGNIPLITAKKDNIKLTSDSVKIPFSLYKNKMSNFEINFKHITGKKYKLLILPKTITDFLGTKNKDTLNIDFIIPPKTEFGKLILEIPNVKKPYFVEVLNKNNKVVRQSKTTTNSKVKLNFLSPGKYFVRIVIDKNKNNCWDTGNYLKHKQAEKVIFINKIIEVRANWEVNQKIEIQE